MKKLQFRENKTIKLQNVFIKKIEYKNQKINFNNIVKKMKSNIKVKGCMQIGPLIQYTKSYINKYNELEVEIQLMLQCNNYIQCIEKSYKMEAIIRVSDCMYCRYIGPEEKLKFVYDKINLEAFENDIELTGESYTVFVEQNSGDDIIIADVFMPKVVKR